MKISTSYLFDRATERMSDLQNRLSTTQAQLAATKQILSPSDAPDKAAAIQRLRGQIDLQDNNSKNLQVAMRRFKVEESALSTSLTLLDRLKELSLQAANDTVGPDDRRAIAVEMKSIRGQLLGLGNTQDDSGNYIFSGTRVNVPAFAVDANGVVQYKGDQTQISIPAGNERQVQFTRSGTDVYSRVIRTDAQGNTSSVGFFDALDQMIEAVENSKTTDIQRSVGDLTQMHNNVSLALAKSGSDQATIDYQSQVIDETTLRLKSTLSQVEDLDYASAVTQMNKEMLALQAAMGSFSKVSNLSLFDYIRN